MIERDPIQLKSGDLGCSTCNVALTSGKVPMYYMKELLGYFDGLKCKICGYGLMTEEGYSVADDVITYGVETISNEIVTIPISGEVTIKSLTGDCKMRT